MDWLLRVCLLRDTSTNCSTRPLTILRFGNGTYISIVNLYLILSKKQQLKLVISLFSKCSLLVVITYSTMFYVMNT